MPNLSVAIICGGPSCERGISLNSARSIMDHMPDVDIDLILYVNAKLEFFIIESHKLYSNTSSDFDFKLQNKPLTLEQLIVALKSIDIVFPVIHGAFGEDGQLQYLLEKYNIPYVGSSSASCKYMFNKWNINQALKKHNFNTIAILDRFKQGDKYSYNYNSKVIVKPNSGGSSIGVSMVENAVEFEKAVNEIFQLGVDQSVIVEELCQGNEFTVIVLQSINGQPVALMPSQIEIFSNNKIFDYRKKYLPSNATRSCCPPKFSQEVVQKIMLDAEKIFNIFEINDFVRIDGWVLNDGRIVFTDINPVSGMEQNSFLFQQAAWVGLEHQDVLYYTLKNACIRYNITYDRHNIIPQITKQKVYVLFGGNSAERQISLMSGTNVWLKLLHSERFIPIPCLLNNNSIWLLPYAYTLSHTVEEILDNCILDKYIGDTKNMIYDIRNRLLLINSIDLYHPYKLNLVEFFDMILANYGCIFLALHGGIGEDGTMQKQLEVKNIKYNGSDSATSKVCMNKYETALIIPEDSYLIQLKQALIHIKNKQLQIVQTGQNVDFELLKNILQCDHLIIKPTSDGCSAGVAQITSQSDLEIYFQYVIADQLCIPAQSLFFQENSIDLPIEAKSKQFIVERFIVVDDIKIDNAQLHIETIHGWVEITVGVLETQGQYHSLNPSITVTQSGILTIEEKFQGGTGINLTPPPIEIITSKQVSLIKFLVEKIASSIKVQNYARIDIFFNRLQNRLIVIEINTLPALTPSTVLFHQALAEHPPLTPLNFIENLIDSYLL